MQVIFSYDFSKIRNLPKIFLRSFENVGPGHNSQGYQSCRRVMRRSETIDACPVGLRPPFIVSYTALGRSRYVITLLFVFSMTVTK